MSLLKKIIEIFKKVSSNYYLIFILGFSLWMLFFDTNNVFRTYSLWREAKDLESEKSLQFEKIETVKKDKEEIMGNDDNLEKYAREKYLMKKSNEVIYVIKKVD